MDYYSILDLDTLSLFRFEVWRVFVFSYENYLSSVVIVSTGHTKLMQHLPSVDEMLWTWHQFLVNDVQMKLHQCWVAVVQMSYAPIDNFYSFPLLKWGRVKERCKKTEDYGQTAVLAACLRSLLFECSFNP